MTENIYYDSGYPEDYESDYLMGYELEHCDPNYDPEHARERKAKFYRYQRYEREV